MADLPPNADRVPTPHAPHAPTLEDSPLEKIDDLNGEALPPPIDHDALEAAGYGATLVFDHAWRHDFVASHRPNCPEFDKNGQPKPTTRNARFFLHCSKLQLEYDDFNRSVLVRGPAGFYGTAASAQPLDQKLLLRIWTVANDCEIAFSTKTIEAAGHYLAATKPVHPVRDYLDSLAWDGKPRIDTWLRDFANANDEPAIRECGRKWLIAGVRRIRKPGTKFDYMLVLSGAAQGQGKSSVPRILAGDDWFCDTLKAGADSIEVLEQIEGRWIVEIAELEGLSRATAQSVKTFASRTADRARKKYTKDTAHAPRQFVMIGTTNETEFLIDATGNRRFWPVTCNGGAGSFDLDGLRAARDQIWAEASHYEAQGESLDLATEHWARLRDLQEKHRVVAHDEEHLTALLAAHERGFVPTNELYKAVGATTEAKKQRAKKTVSSVMERLGWKLRPNDLEVSLKPARQKPWRRRGWFKGDDDYRHCILLLNTAGELEAHTADAIKQKELANTL